MASQHRHGRATATAVAVAAVLAADAVIALVATVALVLPVIVRAADVESGPGRANTVLAAMTFTAFFTLVCPAVAALVGVHRSRATYVLGCVVTGMVTVAVAGLGPLLPQQNIAVLVSAGAVFVVNVLALILLTGLLRPAAVEHAAESTVMPSA